MNRETKIIKEGADTAVLFIHGILGTPRHFDFLLPSLPEDWSRWAILLPGHGGSCGEFAKSSMDEWKSYCENALLELAASHRRVLLVGHSMGTLLSVYLAQRHPDKIEKIFALAMPLRVHFTPVALAGNLHTIFCRPETDNAYYRCCREECSIAPTKNLFAYLRWIPRYLELFALSREIREAMPELKVPCLAIQSMKDELVSRRSIKCTGSAKTIVLPNSRHYFYSEEDRKTIQREFKKFVGESQLT